MFNGLLFTSTNTTGLSRAVTDSSSSCCWPGKSSDACDASSPLISASSPRTTTTRSERRARSTALLNSAVPCASLHGSTAGPPSMVSNWEVYCCESERQERIPPWPEVSACSQPVSANPFQHCDRAARVQIESAPHRQHVPPGVSQRTDHRNRLACALGERKKAVFIPQRDGRALRHLARHTPVFGSANDGLGPRLVGVRPFKKTEPEFGRGDGTDGVVDLRLQAGVNMDMASGNYQGSLGALASRAKPWVTRSRTAKASLTTKP